MKYIISGSFTPGLGLSDEDTESCELLSKIRQHKKIWDSSSSPLPRFVSIYLKTLICLRPNLTTWPKSDNKSRRKSVMLHWKDVLQSKNKDENWDVIITRVLIEYFPFFSWRGMVEPCLEIRVICIYIFMSRIHTQKKGSKRHRFVFKFVDPIVTFWFWTRHHTSLTVLRSAIVRKKTREKEFMMILIP